MANNDRISDFVKSGPRRLLDAEELMQMPTYRGQRSDAGQRHLRAAMYLAGYSVECLLKAYLIEQENAQSLVEAQDKINRRRRSQALEESGVGMGCNAEKPKSFTWQRYGVSL